MWPLSPRACSLLLPGLPACFLTCLLTCLLSGCFSDGPAPLAQPTLAAAPDDVALLVLPDLMDWIVDPAAAVVSAAAQQHVLAGFEPRSDEAWQAVADAAAQLQSASDMLAAPVLARGQADWLQWTAALREGAAAGAAAARRHDPRGLYLAGQQLRASCQACHARHAVPAAADTAEPLALRR